MKRIFTLLFLIGVCFSSQAQVFDSLTGPSVWYNANRSALANGKWNDLTFFKNHAFVVSPAGTPVGYDTINFNKALIFDGEDDYLKIPFTLEGLADFSILAVFQSADTTERGIWGTEQALTRKALLTTRRAIGPDTVPDQYGKSEKIAVLNTVLQSWDKATVASSSDAYIALGSVGTSHTYKPFKGALAEFIVFNRSLSFLERVQYETYLAIKYGTGLRSGNYVSSGEEVLWHTEKNVAYGKNIAGIGRDDYFGLHQKQSGSAYDSALLFMSAGSLAPSNELNTSVLNDQNFILWGDNGLSLSTKHGEGPDSVLMFVERKWLVSVSGTTAKDKVTEVYIDQKRFPAEPLGYWLVIDRSGSGNYSVDNLEYISPERVVDGKVLYKVQWDKDGSGKDNFGFARKRELFVIARTLRHPSCTDETAGKVNVEVIAGKPTFRFRLTHDNGSISREWSNKTTSATVQDELTKGAYTLTVSDGANEKLKRNFTLTMPDALHIDLGPDQLFSATNPITLDVSSQVPDSVKVSYRWENSFGFSTTEKKVTVAEPAVYRVIVTKERDGCVFSDDIAITGSQEQRIAVYPVPVQSDSPYSISVSLPETGSVRVSVLDSKGVLMDEMSGVNNSEYQFITSLRNSGVYVVVIQTPSGVQSYKVIVN